MFIPAFLKELHHEIPSISNSFCWQDESGVLDNIYDETANISVMDIFINSMASKVNDKYSCTIKWVSNLSGGTSSLDHFGECPYVSEYYKTVLLPLGYRNTYFLPIFNNARDKKRLGVLMLHRDKSGGIFTADEKATLKRIGVLIGQGLTRPPEAVNRTIKGSESGMLIVDKKGQINQSCARGDKLLSLASSSQFGSAYSRPEDVIGFSGALSLIHNTLKVSKRTPAEQKSAITIHNQWGDFKLEGFLIKEKDPAIDDRVLINIHWNEPFIIKVFHSIKWLELTPRQETVALFYAAGDSYQEIADKLSLSLHTIKEHVKDLSRSLKIDSRADLIELALCGECHQDMAQ